MRINRNDPESLRCLAAALGSLVNQDFGTVRLSAMKVDDVDVTGGWDETRMRPLGGVSWNGKRNGTYIEIPRFTSV